MAQITGMLSAQEVVNLLGLAPHPEGGFYRETFRDAAESDGGRAASTAIYFLLPAGEISAWHRIDAVEIWHFYAGAPLRLSLCAADGRKQSHILGADLAAGQAPQCVVPAGAWQMAEAAPAAGTGHASAAPWSLVGCTVAPGFSFAAFELAPPGWQPA